MNNMKKLREAASLSQSAVAKALSTTQQTYQRWETGKAKPPIDALQSMALLFKVPLARIIGTPDVSGLSFAQNHYIIASDDTGFWGHLGIQLAGHADSLWFPISAREQARLRSILNGDFDPDEMIQATTLNNRFVSFRADAVARIRLLDDACDDPTDDERWTRGETGILDDEANGLPTILYKAMTALAQDYNDDDEITPDILAQAQTYIDGLNLSQEELSSALLETRILTTDGVAIRCCPNEDSLEDLTMDFAGHGPFIEVFDEDFGSNFILTGRIALVDIPLLALDAARALIDQEYEADPQLKGEPETVGESIRNAF